VRSKIIPASGYGPKSRHRSHFSGFCEIIVDRRTLLAGTNPEVARGPERALLSARGEERPLLQRLADTLVLEFFSKVYFMAVFCLRRRKLA
jgi:hypothetical protein